MGRLRGFDRTKRTGQEARVTRLEPGYPCMSVPKMDHSDYGLILLFGPQAMGYSAGQDSCERSMIPALAEPQVSEDHDPL
ncbi:hypothetical protein D3C86_1920420 [compost metagenome]